MRWFIACLVAATLLMCGGFYYLFTHTEQSGRTTICTNTGCYTKTVF